MKKIIRLSALLASALVITLGSASCDFLNVADDYFTDEISSDSIFTNKRNLEAYMWDISRMFPDEGLLQINPHTPGIYATDEAFSLVNMSQAYDGMAFVLGLVTPTNMRGFLSYYNRNYMAIRRCNDILANINKPQDMKATERALDLGYVHFFRAYAYYRLLLDFGPGINVGDEVLDPNGSTSYYSRPRSTYDEMEEYICNEFEEAARYLPARQSIMNFGRPTKGAAYGMIARLRTYWASPEFNGGEAAHRYFGNWKRSTDGAYYVNQNYDENRWAIAAAACKRVMDMTDGGNPMYKLHTVQASSETPALAPGVTTDPDYYKPWPQGAAGIDPYHSYADMFNGESVIPSNKEWVTVVDDIIFLAHAQHRVMAGTCGHAGILLQNLTDTAEGACRTVADGVGHAVVGSGPATFRPHKVVFAPVLHHVGAFHIVIGSDFLIVASVVEGYEAEQVI